MGGVSTDNIMRYLLGKEKGIGIFLIFVSLTIYIFTFNIYSIVIATIFLGLGIISILFLSEGFIN